jgi:pimeloyl-ACP methyl ester carboxylesterase
VQDPVARTTRVCSYDRSGLGRSGPATGPRDAGVLADDLFQLLKAGKVAGPYVVVGHSLGGYTTRLFASRHRNDVAGLVLVDPSHEDQTRLFGEIAPGAMKAQTGAMTRLRPCADPNRPPNVAKLCAEPPPSDLPPAFAGHDLDAQGPARAQAVLAEFDSFEAGGKVLAAERKPLGDLPLVVLTAGALDAGPGVDPAEKATLQAAWVTLPGDIAPLSPRGVNLVVQGSGHNIQMDKPAAVITAVEGVVATVRAEAKPRTR